MLFNGLNSPLQHRLTLDKEKSQHCAVKTCDIHKEKQYKKFDKNMQ